MLHPHDDWSAMKMLWLLCRTSCKIIAGAARRAHSARRTPSCARRRGQLRPCWPRSDRVSALERGRALDYQNTKAYVAIHIFFKTLHALRSDLARERRVDHAKSIGEQRGGTTWSRRAGTAEERDSASNADRGGRGVEEKEDSGNDPNGEQSFALCPQPNPAARMGVQPVATRWPWHPHSLPLHVAVGVGCWGWPLPPPPCTS